MEINKSKVWDILDRSDYSLPSQEVNEDFYEAMAKIVSKLSEVDKKVIYSNMEGDEFKSILSVLTAPIKEKYRFTLIKMVGEEVIITGSETAYDEEELFDKLMENYNLNRNEWQLQAKPSRG